MILFFRFTLTFALGESVLDVVADDAAAGDDGSTARCCRSLVDANAAAAAAAATIARTGRIAIGVLMALLAILVGIAIPGRRYGPHADAVGQQEQQQWQAEAAAAAPEQLEDAHLSGN